jgi:diguanylate cyclase (GGDEF)-like protein/PAS domain S-box-containing protein
MDADERFLGMSALRRLHDLIGQLNSARGLDATLQTVVDGVVDVVGFEVAAVNLLDSSDELEMVAVAGPADARAKLLGRRRPLRNLMADVELAEHWGALWFIPHEKWPDAGTVSGSGSGTCFVPDIEVSDDPEAWHPQDILYAPLRSPSGELLGVLSVDLPVDRRRPHRAQREVLEIFAAQAAIAVSNELQTQRLRASQEMFRLAFESAGTGMAVVSMDAAGPGRYRQVNPALCKILGYTEGELLSRSCLELTHPDDREDNQSALLSLADGQTGSYQAEPRYIRADGRTVWTTVTASVIRGEDESDSYAIMSVEDVSERRRTEDELKRRAHHDALTGVANRHGLRPRLSGALRAAEARGSEGAVLFCDLDNFKAVNDAHGHAFGDQVLAVIGQRMLHVIRDTDSVIRVGGDEFIVVADHVSPDRADLLTTRLRTAIQAPIVIGDRAVHVSVSVGVASVPVRGGDPDSVLRAADRAMYADKLQAS